MLRTFNVPCIFLRTSFLRAVYVCFLEYSLRLNFLSLSLSLSLSLCIRSTNKRINNIYAENCSRNCDYNTTRVNRFGNRLIISELFIDIDKGISGRAILSIELRTRRFFFRPAMLAFSPDTTLSQYWQTFRR